MSATAVLEKASTSIITKGKNGALTPISTETFYKKYADREDGWKYELVDGYIVKFEKTRNDNQLSLSTNLHHFFY